MAKKRYRIDEGTGCWLWLGKIRRPQGYGVVSRGGRERYAHRVTYEELVGPIPTGLTIDHLCRVRSCVNPAHMQPVTRAENVLRGASGPAVNARKTHCNQGHPFTKKTTYVTREGHRQCRECRRINMNLKRGVTQVDIDERRHACPKGHPYDAPPGKKRRCRMCSAEWLRAYRAKKKGEQ